MAISTSKKDDILFIQVQDPRLLDEARIQTLEKEMIGAIEASSEERVVIDFSKVEFMSSSMLGKLVQVHKKCKGFKVKLKLAGVSPEIREVFKITRLDKLFDIEKDAAAAHKAFAKKGKFG
ncbi:STAS domain-containing protein [Botrimarina sp.]|uniref:STAS domain-containing protein n=1 Tax=Botrimarina sp. TaxID=2795802 RepID=UPI0032EFF496